MAQNNLFNLYYMERAYPVLPRAPCPTLLARAWDPIPVAAIRLGVRDDGRGWGRGAQASRSARGGGSRTRWGVYRTEHTHRRLGRGCIALHFAHTSRGWLGCLVGTQLIPHAVAAHRQTRRPRPCSHGLPVPHHFTSQSQGVLRVRREPSASDTPVESSLMLPPSNGSSHPRPTIEELISNLGRPRLSQGHPRRFQSPPRPTIKELISNLGRPRLSQGHPRRFQPYPVSQPVPVSSRDSRFPQAPRSLSQHVGGPSRNPMQRTSQSLHREHSESHPFLNLETLLLACPSQPLHKSPRTQLPKSQQPSSSLQHEARVAESPREAPLPSQKSQSRTHLEVMPTRSSLTRPSRTESSVASASGHEDDEMDVISSLNPRTAMLRSRPPSMHASVDHVEMVNVGKVPSLEPCTPKRPRSTSPTLGSNKCLIGGPSRNQMQRTPQSLHREQSESHPFLNLETFLSAHPSQQPSSSFQHEARVAKSPHEAPLPSQKSQSRTHLEVMPTRSSQTRPSRTESSVASASGHEDDEMDVQLVSSLNPLTATQRSRPPSMHANVDHVEMDSGPTTSQSGLKPVVLTVEKVLINRSTKIGFKLNYIRKLSLFFHEHCAACWALTGRSWPADHEPFSICHTRMHPDMMTTATASPELAAMQPVFRARAACSTCWLPHIVIDGRLYSQTKSHPISGPGCIHPRPDVLKHVAWAVHSTPDLLHLYCRDFTDLRIPRSITVAQWEAWLAIEWCGMTHLGHLVFWLIRVYGWIQERSTLALYE
ncbi:hypothetical protein C8J57DRAFT_1235612 [Mycena rebaudengoi]|nr:hypothetical protein C8J57DRAFT_1235612 [Mycena rebaudengoi]